MNCDNCIKDYNRHCPVCAYCDYNPINRTDNFKQKPFDMSTVGFHLDFIKICYDTNWNWWIEDFDEFDNVLLIHLPEYGMQLSKELTIPKKHKFTSDKIKYVMERFNLPKENCLVKEYCK